MKPAALDFDLPEGAEPVNAGEGSGRRSWMTPAGLYLAAEKAPDDEAAPGAVDLALGRALGALVVDRSGAVEGMAKVDVPGATEARGGRASFATVQGEPYEMAVITATAGDGEVWMVEVAWPAAAAEVLREPAEAVFGSLRFSSGGDT